LALPAIHRFTVDEYERIVAAGALDDSSRVELIDGYMVTKMGKSAEHGWTTKRILNWLESRLPVGWTARKEEPVRIPAYDEPEPDIAIVQGSDDDYMHRIPTAADVALLVEVSGSTLLTDRGEKLSSYAKDGIPVYWVVNLADRQVEVYTGPGPAGYTSRQDFLPGQQVPVVISGQQLGLIAVDDILPRADLPHGP